MSLRTCNLWIQNHRDQLLDIVRIYLGVALFLKGIFYLLHPAMLSVPEKSGWLNSLLFAVPYIHIIGGLLLALGLFARLGALIQIPVLFAAVFLVHLPQISGMGGREGVEFSALVLFLMVLFAIRGAGPFSLEHRWKTKFSLVPERCQSWFDSHPDIFMDAIRIYLGIGLFLKGFYIMDHRDQFVQLLNESNAQSLFYIMATHYVVVAHFAGGLLLALGLMTRISALAQLPPLIAAVFYLYLPRFSALEMRQNFEFSALVLFLLVVLCIHGAGRFSLDYMIERNYRREHPLDDLQLNPVH